MGMSRKSKDSKPPGEDAPYEMDPETRAAFERAMNRHRKAIKRLAKM